MLEFLLSQAYSWETWHQFPEETEPELLSVVSTSCFLLAAYSAVEKEENGKAYSTKKEEALSHVYRHMYLIYLCSCISH